MGFWGELKCPHCGGKYFRMFKKHFPGGETGTLCNLPADSRYLIAKNEDECSCKRCLSILNRKKALKYNEDYLEGKFDR